MTGVRLEISIDDGGLGRALKRAVDLGGDLKPTLEVSAQVIEGNIDHRFDTGSGPGGIPWQPSRRATEQGGKTLVDKGHLRSSIEHETRPNEVEVGVGANARGNAGKYAATHQWGATIRAKAGGKVVFTGADGGLIFADEVTIPARPFIGFDRQDIADLEDVWTDAVKEPFDGN